MNPGFPEDVMRIHDSSVETSMLLNMLKMDCLIPKNLPQNLNQEICLNLFVRKILII